MTSITHVIPTGTSKEIHFCPVRPSALLQEQTILQSHTILLLKYHLLLVNFYKFMHLLMKI